MRDQLTSFRAALMALVMMAGNPVDVEMIRQGADEKAQCMVQRNTRAEYEWYVP